MLRQMMTIVTAVGLLSTATVSGVSAAPEFVNGLALDGAMLDRSGGTDANTGRVGYFSDLYYDAKRNQWYGLSDRGPGGGSLDYQPRVQRFRLKVDRKTGAISGFKILKTIIFKDEFGNPLNGLAPTPPSVLGNAFDPEGFVVDPRNGHFYVSDEYGPSLYEFNRKGRRVRSFAIPTNLIPRNAAGMPNYASDSGNTAGKRSNRGFEGLAISPDGAYVYAMLQSAMLDEGGSNGVCLRLVKFSTATGTAVAQYAYQLEGASQGRGVSGLLAINDHEFLVLERNNRGIGVGATLSPPNKKLFRIDITGATDYSPPAPPFPSSTCPSGKVTKQPVPFLDLTTDTLPELGNKVPEKWEGLAIGPRLKDGSYVLVVGTDNDYSVTQNDSGTQFDVYFRVSDADPWTTSIQCPLGYTTACFTTADAADGVINERFDLPTDGSYKLLPGVLHAYKVSASDLGDYVRPMAYQKGQKDRDRGASIELDDEDDQEGDEGREDK
ncbi:MAG: esterase-like activity of phytase family protein [Nitrospira sp.]|nr:esterase-like activity of phytase family protein [Nitrospira sp.]MCP9463191.1 esterase-like activity of phytase family protein [Nitrospira sp.]